MEGLLQEGLDVVPPRGRHVHWVLRLTRSLRADHHVLSAREVLHRGEVVDVEGRLRLTSPRLSHAEVHVGLRVHRRQHHVLLQRLRLLLLMSQAPLP